MKEFLHEFWLKYDNSRTRVYSRLALYLAIFNFCLIIILFVIFFYFMT